MLEGYYPCMCSKVICFFSNRTQGWASMNGHVWHIAAFSDWYVETNRFILLWFLLLDSVASASMKLQYLNI